MLAVDPKTVPVARSELTTPLARRRPPTHARDMSMDLSIHANTEHSSKVKKTEQTQSIKKLFTTQMPKSN